ncbi:MAG: carboxynorspermidine decarboxylase [Eubacteriales bacterium]|nr:carboxynorspermidine decarboxylase [Eubacteriales bacterium]MDD3866409.1 carboxynorspermidine decarboxylase [Eubacteriales bacterium]MDD4460939.1 carboxynorspermidine decarboxylase [Eubacteriales bacterium]
MNQTAVPAMDGLFRTPAYLVDQQALIENLEILRQTADRAGCRVLLAQKAFSMFSVYPLIRQYLDGTTASGLFEARLGHDHFGGETHVFSPAYTEADFPEILAVSDHLVFNSFNQWRQFKDRALAAGKQCGMRINPQCPTQSTPLYDPCTAGSRLGVIREAFREDEMDGLSGLHLHCLCEQGAEDLAIVLDALKQRFGDWLPRLDWLNLGGGHHITRPGYNLDLLVRLVRELREAYGVTVYLEPGEAIALNAGYLVSSVIDIVENDLSIAILDTSATCHMPDVLEMPYRPRLIGAALPGEKPHTYRLGGPTCLAGDIIGDYSFDEPLKPGDQLIFCDMAIYTMVKNNTFNGMPLPDIVLMDDQDQLRLIRRFGYEDFRQRLS